MSKTTSLLVYYLVIVSGYIWAGVQLLSKEPFDAMILFIVTHYLRTYRTSVVKFVGKEKTNEQT